MKNWKKYLDSGISFFINHIAWSVATWLFGMFVLNIPRIISWIQTVSTEFLSFSNVLSIISLIISIIIWGIFIKVKLTYDDRDQSITDDSNTGDEDTSTKSNENQNDISINSDITSDSDTPLGAPSLADDIHFTKVTIELYIKSAEDIRYKMKFNGVVNKDGVEEFSKELRWSGSQYFSTKVTSASMEYTLEDNVENRVHPPYIFTVRFNEALNKGEPFKLFTETHVSDKDKNMFRCSSFCIKYPIDELNMVLTAPPGIVKNVRKSGYCDAAREINYFTSKQIQTEDIGDLIKYSYNTNNPREWIYYCIEWDFTDTY